MPIVGPIAVSEREYIALFYKQRLRSTNRIIANITSHRYPSRAKRDQGASPDRALL